MRMRQAVFVFALMALGATGCGKKPAPKPPPIKVEVFTVTPRSVPVYQQWVGTLDGYPNASIRAQVTGYLLKQDYQEGGRVKQGDLLFEIDPRPFQAIVDQARAKLAQDQAALGLTELDVKRYTPLAREQAISQEQLDDAVQSNLQAKAQIVSDQAIIETAELNLGFTKITSPISGIAGLANAQLGDLVGPNSSVLTTVSTVDPIRAYFNIDEQFYLTLARENIASPSPVTNENNIELQLILSDGTVYPSPGRWFFISRQEDVNTGSLQVAALFDNPDSILRPGQYALIRAKTRTLKGALLIPQRAVTELQGSYQIAIVGADNKVHLQTVQVGEQSGSDWVINNGLKANDRVVAEGTQKVKEGTEVDPQPYNPSPSGQTNAAPGTGKG